MEQDLFDRFTAMFGSVNKNLQKVIHREMDKYGLGSAHILCLRQLYRHPEGLTQNELIRNCGVDKAQISRVTGDLIAKDYVEPCTQEKTYNKRLHLTDAGLNITAQITESVEAATSFVRGSLSDEQIHSFFSTLAVAEENLSTLLKNPAALSLSKDGSKKKI